MPKSNESLQASNLVAAEKQVDYWEKQIVAHQKHIIDLKRQMNEAVEKGKEFAKQKAVAAEYLDDLRRAATD